MNLFARKPKYKNSTDPRVKAAIQRHERILTRLEDLTRELIPEGVPRSLLVSISIDGTEATIVAFTDETRTVKQTHHFPHWKYIR